MEPLPLDYAPRPEFDTGLFVARYLQALALLSIGSMIVTWVRDQRFYVDVSFIFLFWTAAALKRHSRTARAIVIGVCGFLLACLLVVLAKGIFFGTGGITVSFGRRYENPPLWMLLVVAAILAVLAGIPFLVLLSAPARRQFAHALAPRPHRLSVRTRST